MNSPTLLPPGHTPAEHAIEASVERAGALPVPLRALWTPETCPERLLPWLAWALALDGWKDYWPLSVKRQRLREAIRIARHKGTVQSVRQVVTAFGSALSMREWFDQTPPGVPHSAAFKLTIGVGVSRTQAYQEEIVREIIRTKPQRTQFSLTAGLQGMGQLGLQGIARPCGQRRLTTEEHP